MVRKFPLIAASLSLALFLAGCGSLNPYPAGRPGWHSPDYHIVFGRLNYVGGSHGHWTLRYAGVVSNDPYGGRLILTPARSMSGFSPGQQVEVFGQLLRNKKSPLMPNALYRVHVIRLWLGTGHRSAITR